jgi:hypothetical protein
MSDHDHRRHGSYNGWCRVEGIPLKARDCPACREADQAIGAVPIL